MFHTEISVATSHKHPSINVQVNTDETINASYLSHQVCGTLLLQP